MEIAGQLHLDGIAEGAPVIVETGAILRGRAELLTPETVECRAVVISLAWETSDKGNAAKDAVKPKVERPGAWTAGPAGAVPFEFTIPADGPVSCQGRLITLRWMLRAEGDIAFKSNPHFVREVIVVPRLWTPEERAAFEAASWDLTKLGGMARGSQPRAPSGVEGPAPGRVEGPAPGGGGGPPSRGSDEPYRDRADDEPRRRVD